MPPCFWRLWATPACATACPRELSYRLAAQMLAGTGKLHLATSQHPGAMKDAVCSPGGTTIRGVEQLERHAFRSAVMDAITAANS